MAGHHHGGRMQTSGVRVPCERCSRHCICLADFGPGVGHVCGPSGGDVSSGCSIARASDIACLPTSVRFTVIAELAEDRVRTAKAFWSGCLHCLDDFNRLGSGPGFLRARQHGRLVYLGHSIEEGRRSEWNAYSAKLGTVMVVYSRQGHSFSPLMAGTLLFARF